MPFLLRSDYEQLIRLDLLNVVADAALDPLILSRAEQAGLTEMQSYLRGRYDLDLIFIDVLPWAAARQYRAGAVVAYQVPAVAAGAGQTPKPAGPVQLYQARRAQQGEKPDPANTPDVLLDLEAANEAAAAQVPPLPADPGPAWVQFDPRNAYLVLLLVDLVLYHVHSRHNPSKIPDLRRDRYDMALDWLKAARAGKMSTGLPPAPVVLPSGEANGQNIRPRGGSLPKLVNAY